MIVQQINNDGQTWNTKTVNALYFHNYNDTQDISIKDKEYKLWPFHHFRKVVTNGNQHIVGIRICILSAFVMYNPQ